MWSTSTPLARSDFVRASATPPRSGMTITRLLLPSFTPVALKKVSGGRNVATGTRLGMRFAASRLARTGAGRSTEGDDDGFVFVCSAFAEDTGAAATGADRSCANLVKLASRAQS